ncbi:MAG: hypothetical protein GWO81_06365 [Verrucomicrobia bacterium]|nr:hypothetical protein [Verrucomicrobiota bacterium]
MHRILLNFSLIALGLFANAQLFANFTSLPQRVVVGYWHNWENDSAPFMKLRDVINTQYNVVNVSFIETWTETETGAPVDFKSDGVHPKFVVYDGSKTTGLTYSAAEFKQDVAAVKAAGIPVLVSIGGQNGHVEISNTEQKDIYVQGNRDSFHSPDRSDIYSFAPPLILQALSQTA